MKALAQVSTYHRMAQVLLDVVFCFHIVFFHYSHFWVMVPVKGISHPTSMNRLGERAGETITKAKEIIFKNLPITFIQFLSDSLFHWGYKNDACESHLKFIGVKSLWWSKVLHWLIQDRITVGKKYLLSHNLFQYISNTQSSQAQLLPPPK